MNRTDEQTPLNSERNKILLISQILNEKYTIYAVIGLISRSMLIIFLTSAILEESDSDCSAPIRSWLLINALSSLVSTMIILFYIYSDIKTWDLGLLISTFLLAIDFSWSILCFSLGTYWVVSDFSCYEQFPIGYCLTIGFLFFCYICNLFAILFGCSVWVFYPDSTEYYLPDEFE